MLDVQGITTRFHTRRGTVRAVNDVSFRVAQGEVVGIVGESGSGKSATIRSILGLIRHPGVVESGAAYLNGQDLLAMSRRELQRVRGADIGFVAQNPFGSLNPILPIEAQFRNVVRAHRRGVSRDEIHDMALAMLEVVGIPGPSRILDGYSHELSGGMAQRVVMALAMLLDPQLVVADEPTTALDVTIQRQILELLRDLVLQQDRSLLLVTHDLGVVAQFCDRVVVFYAGKVVETGPTAQVFRDPSHPYTLGLLESVPRRGQRVRPLEGRVPDLIDYPSGCPYAARCRYAFDRCHEVAPELEPVGGFTDPHREASCHLSSEEVGADVTRTG